MRKEKSVLIAAIILTASLNSTRIAQAVAPSTETLRLMNPYWYAEWLDAGGYSDKFYWGPSPRHNVSERHEMLSGEWGAAIYCDDVGTAQNTAARGGQTSLPVVVWAKILLIAR